MQYMIAFRETADDAASREDPKRAEAYWGGWMAYIKAIEATGFVRGGAGLQPPATGSTVRVRDGKRAIQDGPYADSKEQLGGFFLLEVDKLDIALEWAARAPCAATGSVEVRPCLPPPAAA